MQAVMSTRSTGFVADPQTVSLAIAVCICMWSFRIHSVDLMRAPMPS